ncbi:pilus assembly protein [Hydrogenophaga sp. RWCD_12]|uniref:pilus assembly protein n=1 Tax=Hydrogenophaga sp. RWCD_12 TaxID=3391190 RepID=UPI003984DDB1
MKTPFNVKTIGQALLLIAVGCSALLASAQPSNKPLLSTQSGAKPNLMIALDNSGSMAYPFHESYGLLYNDNNPHTLQFCPAPRYAPQRGVGWVLGGRIDGTNPQNGGAGLFCIQATAFDANGNPTAGNWTGGAQNYAPSLTVNNNLLAQRSADVNPVYYNPRTTYLPRLGPTYANLARPANLIFVSNQGLYDPANNFYTVYRNPVGGALYAINVQKPAPTLPGAWASTAGNIVYSLATNTPFPTHLEYNNAGSVATPAFTYTYCRSPANAGDTTGVSTVQKDAAGAEIGCSSVRRTPINTSAAGTFVSVFAPGHPSAAANIIALPGDHKRTDCAAVNSCTNAEELNNVLNWYVWYSTRQLATSTAIGQALSKTEFQGQLRIGYLPINDYTLAGTSSFIPTVRNPAIAAPGTGTGDVNVLRGVRTLQGSTTASTELFGFLNNIQPRGGTPLHNAISKVAEYYKVPAGAVENPWAVNPAALPSASNLEMSCRRSFNLLFSDGGWTQSYAPAAGPDNDNIAGPTFSRTLADGSTESFQYQPTGENTVAGRMKYTPYPSTGTGGLADLTAGFYWREDFRTGLADNIQTRPGQPTFWQNMATYTVGYFVQPTGEVTGTGLTFASIENYKTQYALVGNAATPKPAWPTGNLVTTSTNQLRVDDFVQAGYTGGGKAFSARSAEDVRKIFDTVLADILSSAGRDAGVSVSSGSGDNSTLAGRFKYTVSYRTLDNSGNIMARVLDAAGNETGATAWSAEVQMPLPSARKVFTMHDTNQAWDFSGNFTDLPSDVRSALKQGPYMARVPNGDNFINYLRGDNTELDADNKLFRQRATKIAAMVNPPSVLMNYSRDYQYDKVTTGGGVDGWDSYEGFAGRKLGYPASLFVATNAGTMHAFNSDTGNEQAAFMPRRSLKRMLAFANEPYNFEYVLDGPISSNDIFNRRYANLNGLPVSEQWKAWRQIGVGSGGRGEQLIYAVNSPFKNGAIPSRAPEKDDFLWETGPDLVNSADGNDVTLGYIANPARSGQTEDTANATNPQRGKWIVAINNGHYNGVAGGAKAGLVVLDALTGDVIRTIPLPAGYSAGRGLSGVTLLRNYELNHRVVAAYAGDANGQLWRFNLTGEPSTWHVENNRPLFTVPGNRPIFGAPAWQPHDLKSSSDGFMVVFATGMMLEDSDLDDLGAQAIYGIWDRKNTDGSITGTDPYVEVLPAQLQLQSVLPATALVKSGSTFYSITDNPIDWKTQRGWFMPLSNPNQTDAALKAGERSIAEVQNIGSTVLVTTTVLRRASNTEMCSVSDLPSNYVYWLDARTAAQSRSRSFDVNGDTRLDPYAVAFLPRGGFTRGVSVVSYYSRPDGTPMTTYALPAPTNGSDPYIPPDVIDRPMGVGADGEYAGSEKGSSSGCKNMRATVLGTETNSLQGGVFCPTTGWSRTQFQLSTPPSN